MEMLTSTSDMMYGIEWFELRRLASDNWLLGLVA